MSKTNANQAEYERLPSSHGHHLHIDFGHPNVADSHHLQHDIQYHHDHHDNSEINCYTCAHGLNLKKTSSESSEATVTDSEVPWVPAEGMFDHPPRREMTESELGSYKSVWVPDPESPTEKDSRPRTLVLCFDGTGDQFDDDNSNIVQFLACLKKNDKERQLVYYQTGIGTTTTSNFITPVMNQVSKTLDSMFAWNLSSHVQDGYQFLVQNYKAGDRISIFGFSRGAYTARALAGMIQRVGLLPADNTQQIPFAWSMYIRDDEEAERDSVEYKRTFSTNVIIDFVGVWDTVASVGITGKELPFVRNNTAIRVFRHALALDEHRAKFMPNFYHAGTSSNSSVESAPSPPTDDFTLVDIGTGSPKAGGSLNRPNVYPKKDRNTPTDACEVWFTGCHCDVGGGSVKNRTAHSLARIPLRWMIRECFRMKTGIIFDARLLYEEIGLDYRNLYPVVIERPPRVPWSKYMASIQKTEPQGWGIVTFVKFIVTVIAIPIRIVLAIIIWPLRHLWLLLKYTKPVKWVRKHPVKWVRKYLGIDWVVSKVKSVGSCINGKLFPKENTTVKPCTMRCKNEEEHEYWDALSPIYDQLEIRWFWKVIEYLPLRFVKQKKGRDDYYVAANFGQGRKIYGDALYKNVAKTSVAGAAKTNGKTNGTTAASVDPASVPLLRHTQGTYHKTGGLKIHRSVLTRIEAESVGQPRYKPLAWWGRREDVGVGKKGPKVKGPDRWDIPDPDPVKYWEWVE